MESQVESDIRFMARHRVGVSTENAVDQCFRVLFVCTGNVHRSAAAAVLLESQLRPDSLVQIASAGTEGRAYSQMGRLSADAVRELGANPDVHVSQTYQPAMAEWADLILVAEPGHREIVLQSTPLAFRRTFTLREFARLAIHVPPLETPDIVTLRRQVELVAAQRGRVAPPTDDESIPDPVGRDAAYTRKVIGQVAASVANVVRVLGI